MTLWTNFIVFPNSKVKIEQVIIFFFDYTNLYILLIKYFFDCYTNLFMAFIFSVQTCFSREACFTPLITMKPQPWLQACIFVKKTKSHGPIRRHLENRCDYVFKIFTMSYKNYIDLATFVFGTLAHAFLSFRSCGFTVIAD